MPNPLEALKKASSIGADPRDKLSGVPVTASVMPMLPPVEGAISGLLGSLKKAVFPEAVSEASVTAPSTLGGADPSYTPVGEEGLYNLGRTVVKQGGDFSEAALKYLRKPADTLAGFKLRP